MAEWRLETGTQPIVQPSAAKKGKTEESEGAAVRKLVYQLKARVRTMECTRSVQRFFMKDHPLVLRSAEVLKKYLDTVKAERPGHVRGPPQPQIFAAVLQDTEAWLREDSCPGRLKRYKGVCERLRTMMQRGGPEEASLWLKDCSFSPTFEASAARLTVNILRHVVLAEGDDAALALAKQQADAWSGVPTDQDFEDQLQRTPLELPVLATGGKPTAVIQVLQTIWRQWGAVQ